MRVGIDVSILSSHLTGIGRFTFSLVESLARVEPNVEWVLLGAPLHLDELPDGPNVTVHRVHGLSGVRRVAWQQVALPRLASRYGLEVLHCPDFSRPVVRAVPIVNTIYDLSYYFSDAYFSLASRTYKRVLTRVAIRNSTTIVALSEFTRGELTRRFRLDEQRVPVIYPGMDSFPAGESVQAGFPFVLYVGTLEVRKNLVALIRAFALLRGQWDLPHRLILAGKAGRGFAEIQPAIRASACEKAIEVPGYVSPERILELYRSADALVMPSLYEGFGLPVLEAMALGTPVVCSRAASLPEVGGEAVEYFDPLSPQEIAAALTRVLGSESLRADMRRKGLARAKQFTWDECARRYYDVYKGAAAT